MSLRTRSESELLSAYEDTSRDLSVKAMQCAPLDTRLKMDLKNITEMDSITLSSWHLKLNLAFSQTKFALKVME